MTNFDGRDFSALLSDSSNMGGLNVLSGSAYDPTSDSSLSGSIATSIVRGPDSNIQGAIGQFTVFDGPANWQANGIGRRRIAGWVGSLVYNPPGSRHFPLLPKASIRQERE